MYAFNGLTDLLSTWEDNGWIGIKNAQFFKAAAAILEQRLATTSFKWIKGHNGTQGNEEADKLAKEGAEKLTPDPLDLSIPKEFNLQGAKLATSPPSHRQRLTKVSSNGNPHYPVALPLRTSSQLEMH
jgi:hypothetical protein